MEPSFERVTDSDVDRMVQCQIEAFDNESIVHPEVPPGGPPGYDSAESFQEDMGCSECYKIVIDGQIVGGIVVRDCGEGHWHLDRIFVIPAFHNRGLGSRALEFIERTHPATRWTLHTPEGAKRNHYFYEKAGYVAGDVWEPPGHDIVLVNYEKTISPSTQPDI